MKAGRRSRIPKDNVKPSRLVALVVLLAIVVAGSWYYLSHRSPGVGNALTNAVL